MLSTYERNPKTKLAATIIITIVVAGIILIADHVKANKSTLTSVIHSPASSVSDTGSTDDSSSNAAPSQTITPSKNTSTASKSTSNNPSADKSHTYEITADYYVPNGQEQIQVKLSLNNGTITQVSIANSESNFTSAQFQESFASVYKSFVVGKKIKGLQLNTLAGASDTTKAFNDALSHIASQA